MRNHGPGRNPLFRKRWFADEVITTCVRWYLRFRLSYRDLASIATELGLRCLRQRFFRWVVDTPENSSAAGHASRWSSASLGARTRLYIKVNGAWMFLYRAGAHCRLLPEPNPRPSAARLF